MRPAGCYVRDPSLQELELTTALELSTIYGPVSGKSYLVLKDTEQGRKGYYDLNDIVRTLLFYGYAA